MRFRLVTYNIHKGIGGIDRLYRPQRIIDTLAHYDADVVFLQEVDDGVPRSAADRQVDLLGDALGLPHRAFQHNVILTQGTYGNAILSRYPLHDTHNLDLTVRYKKRRGALITRCIVRADHQRTVHLVNCHLGLAGFERRTQLRRILKCDALKNLHRTTPLIVGGDYNDVWGTLGTNIMEPAGFSPACKSVKTFPAIMPLRALDRIYFQGDIDLDHSFPGRTAISQQASDHLPIIADFELRI